jgi:hypothetical protein
MSLLLALLTLNAILHGIIVARFGIRNNLPVFVFMLVYAALVHHGLSLRAKRAVGRAVVDDHRYYRLDRHVQQNSPRQKAGDGDLAT